MRSACAGEPRMLINGELVDSGSGRWFDNVDPFTEQALGAVADAEPRDVDRAISAARSAFDSGTWSADLSQRCECLMQLQTALEAEREHSPSWLGR